jgi:hypothetical protein
MRRNTVRTQAGPSVPIFPYGFVSTLRTCRCVHCDGHSVYKQQYLKSRVKTVQLSPPANSRDRSELSLSTSCPFSSAAKHSQNFEMVKTRWLPLFFNFFKVSLHPSPFQVLQYNRAGWRSSQSSNPGRVKNFIFSTSFTPTVRPTHPAIQWVPAALSPGVKRPLRETDRSAPTSTEVKKTWIYTSTPSTRLHGLMLN